MEPKTGKRQFIERVIVVLLGEPEPPIQPSDILVRASLAPLQAQEAVLLRAATEGNERHEEQLVRAVEGHRE